MQEDLSHVLIRALQAKCTNLVKELVLYFRKYSPCSLRAAHRKLRNL